MISARGSCGCCCCGAKRAFLSLRPASSAQLRERGSGLWTGLFPQRVDLRLSIVLEEPVVVLLLLRHKVACFSMY